MPIIDFFRKLFDTSDFPARWHCGNWSDGHGWLHILSDVLIFAAYMAIPIVLAIFIRRRRDLPFPRVFWLFVAFIAFCGIGHLVEAIIFWKPLYRVSGLFKLGTAVASWATVLALVPTLRRALLLRSPEELEREVEARTNDLEREKATLEAVLSAIGSGVAVADADGKITVFNEAAEDILGLGPVREPMEKWAEVYGLYRPDGHRYETDELPLARVLRGTPSVDEDMLVRSPFVQASAR